jgi:hypothetical protein
MDQSLVLLTEKFWRLRPHLNEVGLRLWAAGEALSLGYGGVSEVSRVTGLSRTTIHAGMAELGRPAAALPEGRERRSGGGRKPLVQKDPGLRDALNRLVDPVTRGDPESSLRWTCKSTTKLARELTKGGHSVSQRSVCDLLAQEGYSLQSVRKTREGAHHPDRDAQFHHLNEQAQAAIKARQPVISVDTRSLWALRSSPSIIWLVNIRKLRTSCSSCWNTPAGDGGDKTPARFCLHRDPAVDLRHPGGEDRRLPLRHSSRLP